MSVISQSSTPAPQPIKINLSSDDIKPFLLSAFPVSTRDVFQKRMVNASELKDLDTTASRILKNQSSMTVVETAISQFLFSIAKQYKTDVITVTDSAAIAFVDKDNVPIAFIPSSTVNSVLLPLLNDVIDKIFASTREALSTLDGKNCSFPDIALLSFALYIGGVRNQLVFKALKICKSSTLIDAIESAKWQMHQESAISLNIRSTTYEDSIGLIVNGVNIPFTIRVFQAATLTLSNETTATGSDEFGKVMIKKREPKPTSQTTSSTDTPIVTSTHKPIEL